MNLAATVLALDRIGPDDRRLVGAKAWRLGRLLQADFPVSPGFCLTTQACAAWGPTVRETMLEAYRSFGAGPVAVRSSAVEEDGEGASYAGIYGSELPVSGEAALIAAVERCLASWHNHVAREYRCRVGHAGEFSLALLIQRLVPAVAAGVAYTCDPLRPASRHIHINAVWGLAEPLAAGKVAGDSFVISRRGRLLSSTIAEKHSELTASGSRSVAAERIDLPSLTAAAARQVMKLALRAEDFFGPPQDVEFAVAADGLWLIQARPIVSQRPAAVSAVDGYLEKERRRLARKFAALRRHRMLQGKQGILSNGNVGELLPTPTPMSFGLFQQLFTGPGGAIVAGRRRLGYRFDARSTRHLYELVAGQVYFNLEVDAATFDYGASPPVDFYLEQVLADPGRANYPEVNLYRQCYTPNQAVECFGSDGADEAVQKSAAFHQAMSREAATFLERYGRQATPLCVCADPWRATPAPATARLISRRIRALRTGLCVEFVVAARLGFYFAARVRECLLRWLGKTGESLYSPLLTGLPGSLVTGQALDLEKLLAGQMTRRDFLAIYGHCADNELELSEPRLHETPGKLDALLRDMAASGRSPASEFARQQHQRNETEADLKAQLAAAGITADEQAALFDDLHFAQRLLPLRETIKHHYTAVYADIRQGLLCLAASLGWDVSLVLHLRPQELARAARHPQGWQGVAEARQSERALAREAAKRRLLPDVIYSSRLGDIGQPPPAAGAEGWRGNGLSPGRAWGIARVVDGEKFSGQGEFSGDEILILRSANLGLAPLFRMVAGIVVEVGGLLAHSACQAREAGIPAVLLPGAMAMIPDGCRLMIDGVTGNVCSLSQEGSPDHRTIAKDNDLVAV